MAKQIIIGLPTICEHFSDLFTNMIKANRDLVQSPEVTDYA
jgi:hypothetical protein